MAAIAPVLSSVRARPYARQQLLPDDRRARARSARGLVCRHESQRLQATALHPQRDLGHRRRRAGADLRLHGRLLAGSDRLPGHRRLRLGAFSRCRRWSSSRCSCRDCRRGWPPSTPPAGIPQVALLFASIIAGLVAALVGLLVGAPLMRLSGHYVAVATMGFLIIVNAVAVNWDEVTRGARGLSQIPTSTNPWVAYDLGGDRRLRRPAPAQLPVRPGDDRLPRESHRRPRDRGQRVAHASAGLRRQCLPHRESRDRCWRTRSGRSRRARSISRRPSPSSSWSSWGVWAASPARWWGPSS